MAETRSPKQSFPLYQPGLECLKDVLSFIKGDSLLQGIWSHILEFTAKTKTEVVKCKY